MQSSLIDTTLQEIISNKKLLHIYLDDKSGVYEIGCPFAYNKKLLAVVSITNNAEVDGVYFYSWENINYLKYDSVYLENLEKRINQPKLQATIDKIKSEVKNLDLPQLFTALKNLDEPVEIDIRYDNHAVGKIIAIDENNLVLNGLPVGNIDPTIKSIIPLSHIECISIATGWLQSIKEIST